MTERGPTQRVGQSWIQVCAMGTRRVQRFLPQLWLHPSIFRVEDGGSRGAVAASGCLRLLSVRARPALPSSQDGHCRALRWWKVFRVHGGSSGGGGVVRAPRGSQELAGCSEG